jgi:rod shape-determining protein MreD
VTDRGSAFWSLAKITISLIASVVIQGILAYRFRVFAYVDLPLILNIYYGFTLGRPIASVVIGTTVGLMQDSLSGLPLGTNGFVKTLLGYLAATAGAKFDVDMLVTRVIAIFLFTLGNGVLVSILGLMTGASPNADIGNSAWSWLLSGTLNALLGLLMFGYHDRMTHAAS